MVLGYHVVFSAYGFWLPNDPRGSWSEFVGSWELLRFGPATKVETRRSVALTSHDHRRRLAAKLALKHPPVVLDGFQARAIGRGFAEFIDKSHVTVWACAILPEHVHMVIARHHYKVERIVTQLKGSATRRLLREWIHPFGSLVPEGQRPPGMWGRGCWKVFLDREADVRRAVEYVERNPLKEGKRRQDWSFVTSLDGRG